MDKTKEIINVLRGKELPIKAIAEKLNISQNTLRTQLSILEVKNKIKIRRFGNMKLVRLVR